MTFVPTNAMLEVATMATSSLIELVGVFMSVGGAGSYLA